jgi:dCTP deaminase
MAICDNTIRELYVSGKLNISPRPDWNEQLQTASLDLRLGNEFAIQHPGERAIDPRKDDVSDFTDIVRIPDDRPFRLEPGQFVLSTTIERVEIPTHLIARVEGRSSFGRLGLMVHSTAGFIDPGFRGNITLEMKNIGHRAILLWPGTRICQLAFDALDDEPSMPYSGKYQDQEGVTPSRVSLDHQ